MVKKVALIGIGVGEESLSAEAIKAIAQAQLIFGAKRMLELSVISGKPCVAIFEAEKIRERIEREDKEYYAVLLSGDTGFYSGAHSLVEALVSFEVSVYAGISSVSYFFSKLKRPWQHARLISAHGKEISVADVVRRNAETFVLTGGNTHELAEDLVKAGFGELQVTRGENLGSPEEKITQCSAEELQASPSASLTVLLIDNPHPDRRVLTGIADAKFIRGEVPMSKAPVRAQILSRLRISPEDICYDIGAGTGSVSVEMALAAYEGKVYSIDHNPEAIGLMEKNARAFHLGNIFPIEGQAPEALKELSAPDVAFIGGAGGRMEETMTLLLEKNPKVRIVLSTIALESLTEALMAFKNNHLEPEIMQLGSSRARGAGSVRLMIADNPIYILSAGGEDE